MERHVAGDDPTPQAGSGGQVSRAAAISSLSPELLSPFFHEFRTSLTMIKTCIALLTNPSVTYDAAELREFMDIVRRGGDRVDRLVRDFLTILKLESGVAEREAHEAGPTRDVAAVVRSVERALQHDISERNVTVRVDVPEVLPPLPVAEEHLQMIVEKLLHNAVKFSKSEGGDVYVHVAQEADVLRFEVTDRGVGIPQAEQERIFDGFYQLAQAGLERQGAGLGLAVARGLVELYGGHIQVVSQPGVGSTFSFTLPLAMRVGVAEGGEEAAPEAAAGAGEVPPSLTAEEAFRRLGITFGESPPAEPSSPPQKEAVRRGFFRWRKK